MSQELRAKIANNIKNLRVRKKLKKEELSLMLGFDNSYISKLEKSKINITIDKLDKIARFFDIETYCTVKEHLLFLNALAIHCVDSVIMISYPTSAVDFQSKKPTSVALVGLPVNGLIT